MKITKQYPDICKTCNGSGFIKNPQQATTTNYTVTCPACGGNKTVIVIETSEYDDWLEQIRKIISKSIF